jgi:hypothetical protein
MAEPEPHPAFTIDEHGKFSFEPALERVANALERLSPSSPFHFMAKNPVEILERIAGTLDQILAELKENRRT